MRPDTKPLGDGKHTLGKYHTVIEDYSAPEGGIWLVTDHKGNRVFRSHTLREASEFVSHKEKKEFQELVEKLGL